MNNIYRTWSKNAFLIATNNILFILHVLSRVHEDQILYVIH